MRVVLPESRGRAQPRPLVAAVLLVLLLLWRKEEEKEAEERGGGAGREADVDVLQQAL